VTSWLPAAGGDIKFGGRQGNLKGSWHLFSPQPLPRLEAEERDYIVTRPAAHQLGHHRPGRRRHGPRP